MQKFGIRPEALWGTVQYGVRGFPLTELASGDHEIPLIIQFEGGDEQTLGELRETSLFSPAGAQVPMSAVASVAIRRGPTEIQRQGGRTHATLTVDTAEKDTEALTKKIRKALGGYALPEGFSYQDNRGADLEATERQMQLAFLLSLIFVFLLMGIMFESFILPLAVFAVVPFACAGAIIALGFTGATFDYLGMIAFFLLVGIVVKNGIVLIDCAARLRAEGLERHEALVQAGRMRLRPIVMTALTTTLGLVPMALASATGSQVSYQSLAIATIGGLVVATVITPFLTPITYAAFDDVRTRFMAAFEILLAKRSKAKPVPDSPASSA
jgi:HAE1 family hydrophobic/amphiphilic exporter-1